MWGASCPIVVKFYGIVLHLTLLLADVTYLKFTVFMLSYFIKLPNINKKWPSKSAQNLSVLYKFIKFIFRIKFGFYFVFYAVEFKVNFIRMQQQSRRAGYQNSLGFAHLFI